jgi:hypothetical protein
MPGLPLNEPTVQHVLPALVHDDGCATNKAAKGDENYNINHCAVPQVGLPFKAGWTAGNALQMPAALARH